MIADRIQDYSLGDYEEDAREAEAFFDAECPRKTGGGKRYPYR
jgi:hypothetical protein